MSVIHSFSESLAKSIAVADEAWWEPLYRELFVEFESMVKVEDLALQRRHVDRVITLRGGHTLNIDEKVRDENREDVFLEFLSDAENKVGGWVVDAGLADFFAYVFAPSLHCVLLGAHALRRAWRVNGRAWIDEYHRIDVRNRNHVTSGVAVPLKELRRAMTEAHESKPHAVRRHVSTF